MSNQYLICETRDYRSLSEISQKAIDLFTSYDILFIKVNTPHFSPKKVGLHNGQNSNLK
jgi:hypothetical protein